MTKFQHDLSLRMVKAANGVMMTLPFALCWYLYYANRTASPFYAKGDWMMIALYLLLYIAFGRVYDAFYMSMQEVSEIVYGQLLAAAIADGIIYIVICLLSKGFPNLLPGLGALAVQGVMSVLWAYAARKWYFKRFPPKPTAVIYDERRGLDSLIDEYGLNKKYDVRLTVQVADCLADPNCLDEVETVFLSGIHSHDRNVLLKYCIAKGIDVFVIPRIGDVLMSGAQSMHMFHLPMLRVGRCMASPEYLLTKRVLDILLSLFGLVLTSPLLLVTALAIKCTDGGPVLYKQTRLTKNGAAFSILKFRSMRVDAEKDGVARLSTGVNDDRVTPVGRLIRRFRIDELPQLYCVLRGQMSIVGPRPERPEIAAQYQQSLPEFGLRLQVKAGLTGYAQVYGKYNTPPYDKLQMDLMYISHLSLAEDIKIVLATIRMLFVLESTEGVAKDAVTAGDALPEDQAQVVMAAPQATMASPQTVKTMVVKTVAQTTTESVTQAASRGATLGA